MKRLKRLSLIATLSFLFTVLLALPVHAETIYHTKITGTLLRSEVQEFLDLVNAERAKVGETALELDETAMKISERRAAQMTFLTGHSDPMNGGPYQETFTEIEGTPISEYEWGSENALIFTGHPKRDNFAQIAFEEWMNSSGHRETLLHGASTRVGIAFFVQDTNPDLDTPCTVAFNRMLTTAEYPLNPYKGSLTDMKRTFAIDVEDIRLKVEERYFSQYWGSKDRPYPALSYGEKHQEEARYLNSAGGLNSGGGFSLDNSCGKWISNNPDVITVTQDGIVKAVGPGKGSVSFLVNGDPNKKYTYYYKIIGDAPEPTVGKVSGISVKKVNNASVKLSWKNVSNASGYEILRSNKSNSGYKRIATSKSESVTVEATLGKQCYYKVRAYKKQGGKSYYGSYSTPKKYTLEIPKAVMTNAKAGKRYINLNWKRIPVVSGYQIYVYRKNPQGQSYDKHSAYISRSSNISGKVTGLKSGKSYYVRVRAYKTVNGKRIYGDFSSRKKIKVK